jgi:hypothetical protein
MSKRNKEVRKVAKKTKKAEKKIRKNDDKVDTSSVPWRLIRRVKAANGSGLFAASCCALRWQRPVLWVINVLKLGRTMQTRIALQGRLYEASLFLF